MHADLSEFNTITQSSRHILIIDWPQYVTKDHPKAEQLLERDVCNVVRFLQVKLKAKQV